MCHGVCILAKDAKKIKTLIDSQNLLNTKLKTKKIDENIIFPVTIKGKKNSGM